MEDTIETTVSSNIDRKFAEKQAALEKQLADLRIGHSQIVKITKEDLPLTRIELARHLRALESLDIEEEYAPHLLAILKDAGKAGVTLSILRKVLPEADKLTVARKALLETKQVREDKEGQAVRLAYIDQETVAPSQTV